MSWEVIDYTPCPCCSGACNSTWRLDPCYAAATGCNVCDSGTTPRVVRVNLTPLVLCTGIRNGTGDLGQPISRDVSGTFPAYVDLYQVAGSPCSYHGSTTSPVLMAYSQANGSGTMTPTSGCSFDYFRAGYPFPSSPPSYAQLQISNSVFLGNNQATQTSGNCLAVHTITNNIPFDNSCPFANVTKGGETLTFTPDPSGVSVPGKCGSASGIYITNNLNADGRFSGSPINKVAEINGVCYNVAASGCFLNMGTSVYISNVQSDCPTCCSGAICPTDCTGCPSAYSFSVGGGSGTCSGANGNWTVSKSSCTWSSSAPPSGASGTMSLGCVSGSWQMVWNNASSDLKPNVNGCPPTGSYTMICSGGGSFIGTLS